MAKLYLGNRMVTPVVTVGGETERKYGASINDVLGDVDANGRLNPATPDTEFSLVFDNAVSIYSYALAYRFNGTGVTSVSFPDLTSIKQRYACLGAFRSCPKLVSISFPKLKSIGTRIIKYSCESMFYDCNALTSVSFPELESIAGTNACYSMFYDCDALTSVSFPKLQTINDENACYSMFYNCKALTSVSFPELQTINGYHVCYGMFGYCYELTSVSFPALERITGHYILEEMFFRAGRNGTSLSISFPKLKANSFDDYTDQFTDMLAEVRSAVTIHFPNNLQSIISRLTGYPSFGGYNVTVAFDLPATS